MGSTNSLEKSGDSAGSTAVWRGSPSGCRGGSMGGNAVLRICYVIICVSTCSLWQTWHVETFLQIGIYLNGNIIYRLVIFHCHVWLPEGVYIYLFYVDIIYIILYRWFVSISLVWFTSLHWLMLNLLVQCYVWIHWSVPSVYYIYIHK